MDTAARMKSDPENVSHLENETAAELYDDNNSEHARLRRVPGSLPWQLFTVCVLEMGERFVYNGLSSPLQNYIQNPYPYDDAGIPGALGRGQSVGVALGNFFKFWAYLSTVFGAIIADQYLGKFKTVIASTPIYVIGMVVLVATSAPVALRANAGMGGLITAMITIGLGTGGLKACIAPMCAEQNPDTEAHVKTTKSGERVVVDPNLTSARVFMWYYWAANLGSLAGLVTTSIEKSHSFWLCYLVPLLVFIATFVVFIVGHRRLVKVPATGSPIVEASRTITIAVKERGFANATPSALAASHRREKYKFARQEGYTDLYVAGIKSAVGACKYFVLFPFYFLVWVQSYSNLVAQAGSMDNGATPNDLMQSLQIIFMLAFIPMLDLGVYPLLRKKWNLILSPILRILMGFTSAALAMAYACILQHFIYSEPESSIGIWIQAPAYVFLALSECWLIITGLEVAFVKSPENLRAFVSSIFWLTIAVGSAIAIALSPVSQDPYMVWLFGALAVAAFVAGCLFYVWFRDSLKDGPPKSVGASVGGELGKKE